MQTLTRAFRTISRSPVTGPALLMAGSSVLALAAAYVLAMSPVASADELPLDSESRAPAASDANGGFARYLRDAQSLHSSGDYVGAARYAYAAAEAAGSDDGRRAEAYSWVSTSLVRGGYENAASYFFIRTLQLGGSNRLAMRRALMQTQTLFSAVGPDLFRKYLVKHTKYEDYDLTNRNAFLYSLGKEAILADQNERAVGYLSGIEGSSPLWPFALQLRGTANALLGKNEEAISDFRECASKAGDSKGSSSTRARKVLAEKEGEDLEARCHAGEARTLYQMERFLDAERAYDQIPKASIVWPDILFEQAWNAYAKEEYNRTLGKLVSYRSPALSFMFNSEVDVLNAQTYLALCLYADANDAVNRFNSSYQKVGEDVKRFVEGNANNLYAFFDFGKKALHASRYVKNDSYRMANRFVRGPYFQRLVLSEKEAIDELRALTRKAGGAQRGFSGFLGEVLKWRLKTIRMLGGAFVKNSLIDFHTSLIADFEKMAFIKLEMLKRAKEKLIYKKASAGERSRGNVVPERRNDQYYWSFNGEFWNDELGDYVFGLESECGGAEG